MSLADIAVTLLRVVAISMACYVLIALALIASQWPSVMLSEQTLDFSSLRPARGDHTHSDVGNAEAAPLQSYQARDGARLSYRRYPPARSDTPLLVFVHGSGWHGAAYDKLARRIAATGSAEVILPDLRGHGPDPDTRGDVAYIGQLEDDIADLVATLSRPGQKLVVGGHSSGGGLAIRYAGGPYGTELDAAVLLAPFLKYDAPTMRPASGGWSRALTRRIIGLSMLNAIGITALNGLEIIQFSLPQEVLDGPQGASATTAYSFRLNSSYAPRSDYLADVAKLPPFLLVAGTEDEAFIASAYEPLMSQAHPGGRYRLIEGQSHLGVIEDPESARLIADFLDTLPR